MAGTRRDLEIIAKEMLRRQLKLKARVGVLTRRVQRINALPETDPRKAARFRDLEFEIRCVQDELGKLQREWAAYELEWTAESSSQPTDDQDANPPESTPAPPLKRRAARARSTATSRRDGGTVALDEATQIARNALLAMEVDWKREPPDQFELDLRHAIIARVEKQNQKHGAEAVCLALMRLSGCPNYYDLEDQVYVASDLSDAIKRWRDTVREGAEESRRADAKRLQEAALRDLERTKGQSRPKRRNPRPPTDTDAWELTRASILDVFAKIDALSESHPPVCYDMLDVCPHYAAYEVRSIRCSLDRVDKDDIVAVVKLIKSSSNIAARFNLHVNVYLPRLSDYD